MPLEFIDLNSPPIAAVNRDNGKAMGKKNGTEPGLKNQEKTITEFRKKTITKNFNFEINKELERK